MERYEFIVIHPFRHDWKELYNWCQEHFGLTNTGRWQYDCNTDMHDCYSFAEEVDRNWFILRWL